MDAQGSKKIIFLLLGITLTSLNAQHIMNATGATATGNGGSVTYSVGQVAIENSSGADGSVARGVQHAYEIFEVSEDPTQYRENYKGIALSVSAKFSPNADMLMLQVPNIGSLKLTFQLFSLQGKVLTSQDITQPQTIIDMSQMAPASYFAKVMQGSVAVKTFKIIKN